MPDPRRSSHAVSDGSDGPSPPVSPRSPNPVTVELIRRGVMSDPQKSPPVQAARRLSEAHAQAQAKAQAEAEEKARAKAMMNARHERTFYAVAQSIALDGPMNTRLAEPFSPGGEPVMRKASDQPLGKMLKDQAAEIGSAAKDGLENIAKGIVRRFSGGAAGGERPKFGSDENSKQDGRTDK